MGKIIWITGAGSGIGKALAQAYDRDNNTIILSGRRTDTLEKVAAGLKCNAHVEALDVTDEAQIDRAVLRILSQYKKVDILINNAGVSQRSLAADTDNAVGRKIMEVNFFGAVYLSKALIPQFKEHGGDIIIISSLSGKFGFPLRSYYAASKHALHGYFETLGLELADFGVNVLLVCPGRIKTDISLNALKGDGEKHAQMDEGQMKGIEPEICAKKIVRAAEYKKKEIYIGKSDVLMVYFKRYCPPLFRFIARRIKAT